VVLPGDPTELEITWTKLCGHPTDGTHEPDRAKRLQLTTEVSELSDAVIELGCWRQRISNLPPGPELVAELTQRPDRLAPSPLSDPDQALQDAVTARTGGITDRVINGYANAVLDSITCRARILSWLQAEQHTDLAMLSRNYPGLYEMLPTEVGFALRISESAAGNMISQARALSTRVPRTMQALRDGLISHDHALAIGKATSTTTPEIATQVEADLLPCVTATGSTITAEQLRRRAVRRVIKLDPDGAADRHRKAAVDRRITRWMEEDGMAGVKIYAPAQDIAIIWETATSLADAAKTPGDHRNLGNRRVDALTDLCADILYRQSRRAPHEAGVSQPAAPDANADSACSDTAAGANWDIAEPAGTETGTTGSACTEPGAMATDAATESAAAPVPATETTPDATAMEAQRPGTAGSTVSSPVTSAAGMPSAGLPILNRGPVFETCQTCGRARGDTATPPPNPRALPKTHGQRPHIQVVIPYTVLLGGNEPCELVGHGAITADQARLIADDGVLRRLVTDPLSGTLLDYGRTRYEPPESLKQFVITRDGTCQAPGCLQPAQRGQIDHVDPFHPGKLSGGNTNHSDLKTYCQHHHRAKDGGGFTNSIGPDGSSHWITPLGRQYSRLPNEIWHPEDHESLEPADDLDDGFPRDQRVRPSHLTPEPTATQEQTSKAPVDYSSAEAAEQCRPDEEPPF